MKIDIHTHILPEELPDFARQFGYSGFIKLEKQHDGSILMLADNGKHFRTIQPNCCRIHERLKDCDRTSVDVQVLSTVPVMFSYHAKPKDGHEVARYLNDHMAEQIKNNKRFIGLGTLPLQDIELSIQEAKRALNLGLKGFQIGSNINGKNLSDPEFHP
ncbi:MAG: amidohydrolase family protein, partial [Bdellovibrionaceae bacterium]|nr:amidohydrolase family protein [Pseudobdellovibrionaceae bacterium]